MKRLKRALHTHEMTVESVTEDRRFRRYRVVARTAESDGITSFSLVADGGADGNEGTAAQSVPPYRPGQYLAFRLMIDGAPVLRNYSLCGDPDDRQVLRIAVKRELAPAHIPDAPAGQGSNYMHDHVSVGDVLSAAGPLGDFCLDESSARPVVLLSGGVGVTPVLSMFYRLVRQTQRRVTFIHACDRGAAHAFRAEVEALAAQRRDVHVHFCYRQPTDQDRSAGAFHSKGLLDREQLQALLPLDDYEFYLCGPSGFMQANWQLIRSLGVRAERIHYEFFGPATVFTDERERSPSVPDSDADTSDAAAAQPDESRCVRFLPADISADWSDDHESLLDLAEHVGLSPEFNCRAGLCNTCMSTLVSGQVDYSEPPLDDVPEGRVLLCCSRPVGPVVIKLISGS